MGLTQRRGQLVDLGLHCCSRDDGPGLPPSTSPARPSGNCNFHRDTDGTLSTICRLPSTDITGGRDNVNISC